MYVPESGNWNSLDDLFGECFASTPKKEELDAIFSLFERYPEEDGAGVFWSAIHGLEAVGGYEGRLKGSLSASPSLSAVALAIRIVNSGDPAFLPLIADVALRRDAPDSVRSAASRYVAKQKKG